MKLRQVSMRLFALLALLLGGALFGYGTSPAQAGANETPGENFRPKRFGSFSPNLWEFGAVDIGIFQSIVVGSQHYAQGASYGDATNDYSSGGAGIWNFFTFCTDRRHDVMLVTSHGAPLPSTTVEAYPWTARGRAVRDSVLTYYNGVFGPGRLVAQNSWRHYYGIDVTQAFYTAYFQTPRALAWWATCWSSLLSMTGPAEARDFLGYDNSVFSSKCYCDERRILGRMDGQEGQALRPLGAAMAGINGLCPPGGANLVHAGRGNTVISPSVTGNAPTGVVCEPTDGFVQFDCTMDTTVPPQAVVVARGDGVLVNHQWAGDDRVTFTVVPIRPCPTIMYDVIESAARSRANRSRLDGNTNPPVNALGPNHDDYIWWTHCPWWPGIPVLIPDLVYLTVPTPDLDLILYTALTNQSPEFTTVTGTLFLNETPVLTQTFDLEPSQLLPTTWPVTIPATALEGDVLMGRLEVNGPGGPYNVSTPITIGSRLQVERIGPPVALAGPPAFFDIAYSLAPGDPMLLEQAHLVDTHGWAMPAMFDLLLDAGVAQSIEMPYLVPEGTDPGTSSEFRVEALVDGVPRVFPLGSVTVGAPIVAHDRARRDIVPGSLDAAIEIELVSLSLQSVEPTATATSSHGFPCTILCPPLPPGASVPAEIVMQIPLDPTLVGQTGSVHLELIDPSGLTVGYDFDYQIAPAIEVQTARQSVHTGSASPRLFSWPVTLKNRSDVPMSGVVQCVPSALQTAVTNFSFNLAPGQELIRDVQLRVLPDLPPGNYPIQLLVSGNPSAAQQRMIEHQVTNPVVVDLIARAYSGLEGEVVTLQAAIQNRRTDHPMSGTFSVSDDAGWLPGPLLGNFALAPGQSDTLEIEITVGGMSRSASDSTVVTMTVAQIYDTGLPAESRGSTTLFRMAVSDVGDGLTTTASGIESAWPNPVRDQARILFHLGTAGRATVTVHDAAGRRVATLTDGPLGAGAHELRFARNSEAGDRLVSGIYFVRLATESGSESRKLVLIE
ncbi:MAG: T9SS type A sorting domain-containing protein [Candidatus Eisenbacteria bacterium]|nr:T9SS type A sorting domain-containing protein [Candidatus Eisenbacteria bacterium]